MCAALLQALYAESSPTFLAIGHVTRDLLPHKTFLLGGTGAFAALTADRLGLTSSLVTCADETLLTELSTQLPNVGLAVRTVSTTTTFENSYTDGFRVQYLRARAPDLELGDIPQKWLAAPITLLGPLAQEIPLSLIRALPHPGTSLLAATPQGWLRRWDTDGRIWPTPWTAAEEILPLLDVLILSHDDLLPFAWGQRTEADALLSRWSKHVPLLVATDGYRGATLFERGIRTHFPAYPTHEVDPTGAGDVFATAFLASLFQQRDPQVAMNFANCAASLSIEQPGMLGIPTLAEVQQCLR